eukprot:TRINITY_DN92234_c0_g1_i1.p1 TRINITY_DN92234_c0_g1~~TRINITY_DN92234_c0_g1_i1.p1  ORF type:complete len:125 (+),score=14.06 TRINITY_DN92234_c0_g1_i1:176-550(+)
MAFAVGKVYATIEQSDITAPDDNIIEINDTETYHKYHEFDDKFYSQIIDPTLMSEYPESVLEIDEKYKMGPMSGYLTKECPQDSYNSIDCVKPIQTVFKILLTYQFLDTLIYQKYGNHEIEDLC